MKYIALILILFLPFLVKAQSNQDQYLGLPNNTVIVRGNLQINGGSAMWGTPDTSLSYFLSHIVTGLNIKIVVDGNSNSVGYNNPSYSGINIANSYGTTAFNQLGGTAAGYQVDVLGVPSYTTTQMIANASTVIDTAYNAAKTLNYLFAWEGENDIQINGLSSYVAWNHLNTYWTSRNGVGFRTIGATSLPKGNGTTFFDSTTVYRIDSLNLALINSHTSDLFIDFTHNPWLNNNMSRAGFGPDYIHMNSSGTKVMADSFALVVKRDLGQKLPTPSRPVFWGGNVVDRNMVIGPLNGYGVSLLANSMPVFDVTQYGGISYIGQKVAEGFNTNNIGFTIYPSFWNPNGYTNTQNYDLGLNTESQWINAGGQKVAFFNPFGTIMNTGFGIDIFANLQPGQSTTYFNSAFGTHALQASGIGTFNTMVGSFSSDVHTSSQNVIVGSGEAIGTIGNQNTWVGANGSIANSTSESTTIGFGNTQNSSNSVVVGASNNISGTAAEGGSLIVGNNRDDGGFHSILLGNVSNDTYGTAPTADGQMIIGDIYNPDGKAIRYVSFGGNQAVNNTIASEFSPFTLTVAGIAGGGSNTNLSAAAAELDIYGSVGTGNAASGDVVIGAAKAGSSGTTRETVNKLLRVGADQTVRFYGGVFLNMMTNTNRDALTPSEGMTIYSTTDHTIEFYNGSAWKQVATN